MKSAILFYVLCWILNNAYGQTMCSTRDDIQLNMAGFFSSGAGCVEICQCSNNEDNSTCFWATVNTGSTQPWGWINAIVVCRELGYNNVMNPILQNTVPSRYHASDSVSIYQSLFRCDGTESTLTDCMTSSLPDFSTHANDAYIKCQTTSFFGDVRLIGTNADTTGVVEYYDGSRWLTICPTEWDNIDAEVVCRSLGYDGGTSTTYVNSFQGSEIDTQTSITLASCGGGEISFSDCPVTLSSGCSSTTFAGVFCTESSLAIGSVRLFFFPSTETFSRVEVLYAGRWGTVCGSVTWSELDGRVACTELGFDGTVVKLPDSVTFSSTSSRPIWVSGYNCVNDETTLESCSKENPIGYAPSCTHANDAGLTCGNDETTPTEAPTIRGGGGLSGGAIAGIVIAVLVFLFLMGGFIAWKKKTDEARAAAARAAAASNTTAPPPPTTTTRTRTPMTTNEEIAMETNPSVFQIREQPIPPVLENPELTKEEPPSYDDAIELNRVKPPPQYAPPTSDENLPYPTTAGYYDPVYPPGGPSYQGYPQPTFPTNFPPQPGYVPGTPNPLPPQTHFPSAPPPFHEQRNNPY